MPDLELQFEVSWTSTAPASDQSCDPADLEHDDGSSDDNHDRTGYHLAAVDLATDQPPDGGAGLSRALDHDP